MLILIGQAEASSEASGFPRGSIHSVVAVVHTEHATDAERLVTEELARAAVFYFSGARASRVPTCRSLLPCAHGSTFREALRKGFVINLFATDNRQREA